MAKNMNKTPDQLIQEFIDEQGKPTVVKRKKPNKPKGAKAPTESSTNDTTPKVKPTQQRTKKSTSSKQDTVEQTEYEQFVRARRQQDKQQKEKIKTAKDFQDKFNEGEIAYNNIVDLIDSCDKQAQYEQANKVKQRLDEDIATYGKDAVMQVIAYAYQAIEDITKYIMQYYWDVGKVSMVLYQLDALIRGYIPDMEEAKQIAEEYERATYTDSNTFIPSSQEEYEELPEEWR